MTTTPKNSARNNSIEKRTRCFILLLLSFSRKYLTIKKEACDNTADTCNQHYNIKFHYCSSSYINSSSIDISKKRAILNARMMDGLYLPFSREPIVCLDTSKAVASSSCLIPCCFRISSSRFFKISPQYTTHDPRILLLASASPARRGGEYFHLCNGKYALHRKNIIKSTSCQADFPCRLGEIALTVFKKRCLGDWFAKAALM